MNSMTSLRCPSLKLLLAAAVLWLCVMPAAAQVSYPKYRCPGGEYMGPDAGKTQYLKDPYTWFVTREFAQRFCMPQEYIAEDLQGAEAIAFRHKPLEIESCRLVDGKEVCGRGHVLWMELYVSATANIPKYDSEIGFYVREPISSGSFIANAQGMRNAERRRSSQWLDPAGRRAPFSGANRRDGKPRTSFILLGVQADDTVRYHTVFTEDYYEENWVEGIHVIGLQQMAFANPRGVEMARKDKREAFGVLSGYLGNETQTEATKRRLADFLHVIELPRRLSELQLEIGIRAYEATRPRQPSPPQR
jgi:hypothetical protein